MKDIKDIAFIIQSRKGSVRVKNKMLKPFNGSCLFEIAIQKILKSKIIPKENFYVSILDDEFKSIANKHKVNIFHRSQESTVEPVELPTVFGWHKKEALNKPYKYWVKINGCNPLLSINTSGEVDMINALNSQSSLSQWANMENRNNSVGLPILDMSNIEPISSADIEKLYFGDAQFSTTPSHWLVDNINYNRKEIK